MKVHDVEIEHIKNNTSEELSDSFYRNCNFCNKISRINSENLKSCLQLSGDNFFCSFCLRHNFHHKLSNNVLIMSFRGIIGYYYWGLYRCDFKKSIWYSEIKNLIDFHVALGLQSPVFYYDPSTYLWFVDFNRIGKGNKKVPIEEVKSVIKSILMTFNLNIRAHASEDEVWKRFEQAINLYYSHRKRPKDKKMLIPTLIDICGNQYKDDFWEKTRSFSPANFIIK